MTVVLPPHRVRLYAHGRGGSAGPQGRGRAAGRSAPPSRAASRAEPRRQADKAPPAPSPTAAFQKGGGRRARGRWEEERGGGRPRKRRREGAADGTGQDRAEEGGEGGGAGRPRRTRRREGFLKPKINKLFLFTCGVGEVGSESSGLSSSPPPRRLFVTERPAKARASTRTTPGAYDARTGDMRYSYAAHRQGLPRRPSRCDLRVKQAKARGPAALPVSHRPPHPAHARNPNQGGAAGEGAADTFPKLPARPPTPKGKQKNRRVEIGERILPSGLGGGNCPFLRRS